MNKIFSHSQELESLSHHTQQSVIVAVILVPAFKFNLQSSSWNEYGTGNNTERKSKLTMNGSKLAKP